MKWLALVALIGCGTSGNLDVVGPFHGPIHRFVVDGFTLPNGATQLGDDLNGDGTVDNQLGSAIASLAEQDTGVAFAPDMIAAGAIASSVEIETDDLDDASKVAVWYYGATSDEATAAAGTLVDGSFRSNRTATTTHPGEATLVLPVFADADPVVVPLIDMEIDLDPSIAGGYDATIRGGVPADAAHDAAVAGIVQMVEADPSMHAGLVFVLGDAPGSAPSAVVDRSDLLASLLASDVTLEGTRCVSFGFGVHLSPCDAGSCVTAPPADRCHDRARDGDETDVDCGGSCEPCAGGQACGAASDCNTGSCDGGWCRAATCSDGMLDGFEEQADCGGDCLGCVGDRCSSGEQCRSGVCSTDSLFPSCQPAS